ncbi:MAG TPA: hypothetical protein VGE01_07655 [Fimbriimonas sp.]
MVDHKLRLVLALILIVPLVGCSNPQVGLTDKPPPKGGPPRPGAEGGHNPPGFKPPADAR